MSSTILPFEMQCDDCKELRVNRKNKLIQFRLSEKEHSILLHKASIKGFNISDYIRGHLLLFELDIEAKIEDMHYKISRMHKEVMQK